MSSIAQSTSSGMPFEKKKTSIVTLELSRFLQIRLGNESCDQISASPNGPRRAKSRDSCDKSRESYDKTSHPQRRLQEVKLFVFE